MGRQVRLAMLVPPMLIEDHTVVGHRVVETLQYWPHTPVSLIPQLFHYGKRQLRTRSVEMVRVACTHPVYPPGVAQGGGVLCSQVAKTGSRFGGSE